MFRTGLVDTLVTHANIKGFGLTPLSGDRHGYMPSLLKTKHESYISTFYPLHNSEIFINIFDLMPLEKKDVSWLLIHMTNFCAQKGFGQFLSSW